MRHHVTWLLLLSLFSVTCTVEANEANRPSAVGSGRVKLVHVLVVGPNKALRRPSQAAQSARDGDVIEIEAGVYSGDVAVWTRNDLTIRGINGRAHLEAKGTAAEGKAIWVIKGRNTTVENIEFSGAKVADENGAGIRQEGAGLTVRNCYFHDNEDGLLAGANPESDVVIEGSEFANNSHGDGQSHNIYIGQVKRFTLRASYSHHAKIGHNVKSRARENFILYNRIMDEQTGTASYEVEVCNGGLAYLIGNLIHKGPQADNGTLVSFGAEGFAYPTNQLYAVNNTLVNDYPGGRFITAAPGTTTVKIVNNIFAGPGVVLTGPGDAIHNLQSTDPGFVNRAWYDYHLQAGSPAIDAGVAPGTANAFQLTPTAEYVHPLGERPRKRVGGLDLGAYEHQ